MCSYCHLATLLKVRVRLSLDIKAGSSIIPTNPRLSLLSIMSSTDEPCIKPNYRHYSAFRLQGLGFIHNESWPYNGIFCEGLIILIIERTWAVPSGRNWPPQKNITSDKWDALYFRLHEWQGWRTLNPDMRRMKSHCTGWHITLFPTSCGQQNNSCF